MTAGEPTPNKFQDYLTRTPSDAHGCLRNTSLLSSPGPDESDGKSDDERNSEIANVAELLGTIAGSHHRCRRRVAAFHHRPGEPLRADQELDNCDRDREQQAADQSDEGGLQIAHGLWPRRGTHADTAPSRNTNAITKSNPRNIAATTSSRTPENLASEWTLRPSAHGEAKARSWCSIESFRICQLRIRQPDRVQRSHHRGRWPESIVPGYGRQSRSTNFSPLKAFGYVGRLWRAASSHSAGLETVYSPSRITRQRHSNRSHL